MRCTPNSGPKPEGREFFMKYTREFKLDSVNEYKNGISVLKQKDFFQKR